MDRQLGFSGCVEQYETRDFLLPRRQDYSPVPPSQLSSLFQRGHGIEDYVEDFIAISHCVKITEMEIKDYFLSGLDLELLRDLPDEDPNFTLCELIDFVLLYCGSHFTVGEVEEHGHSRDHGENEQRAAHVSASPWLGTRLMIRQTPLPHKMAADRETPNKMAANRETPHKRAPAGDLRLISRLADPPMMSVKAAGLTRMSTPSTSTVSNPETRGFMPVTRQEGPCLTPSVPVEQPGMLPSAPPIPAPQLNELASALAISEALGMGSDNATQREGLCGAPYGPVLSPVELPKALTSSSPPLTGISPVTRYEGPCLSLPVPVAQPLELSKALTSSNQPFTGFSPKTRYEGPCIAPSGSDLDFEWPDPPDPIGYPGPLAPGSLEPKEACLALEVCEAPWPEPPELGHDRGDTEDPLESVQSSSDSEARFEEPSVTQSVSVIQPGEPLKAQLVSGSDGVLESWTRTRVRLESLFFGLESDSRIHSLDL